MKNKDNTPSRVQQEHTGEWVLMVPYKGNAGSLFLQWVSKHIIGSLCISGIFKRTTTREKSNYTKVYLDGKKNADNAREYINTRL